MFSTARRTQKLYITKFFITQNSLSRERLALPEATGFPTEFLTSTTQVHSLNYVCMVPSSTCSLTLRVRVFAGAPDKYMRCECTLTAIPPRATACVAAYLLRRVAGRFRAYASSSFLYHSAVGAAVTHSARTISFQLSKAARDGGTSVAARGSAWQRGATGCAHLGRKGRPWGRGRRSASSSRLPTP